MSALSLTPETPIVVVGLGYVGLPLAVALAKKFKVTGFDISEQRISELKDGFDRTEEIDRERLEASTIAITNSVDDIKGAAVYIVTVPTPVDENNKPDLTPVRASCETLGPVIGKGSIIVFESTVYPGVTDEICGPILSEKSGLVCGEDFFLGYSPERINPGDKVHTVDKINGNLNAINSVVIEVLNSHNELHKFFLNVHSEALKNSDEYFKKTKGEQKYNRHLDKLLTCLVFLQLP